MERADPAVMPVKAEEEAAAERREREWEEARQREAELDQLHGRGTTCFLDDSNCSCRQRRLIVWFVTESEGATQIMTHSPTRGCRMREPAPAEFGVCSALGLARYRT